METNIRKTIITLLLALCMAIFVFAINTVAKDSNSTDTVTDFSVHNNECETVVKEYSKAEVEKYLENDNDYLELEGYLFAGWYTDNACTKDTILGSAVPTGATYALFVPDHV